MSLMGAELARSTPSSSSYRCPVRKRPRRGSVGPKPAGPGRLCCPTRRAAAGYLFDLGLSPDSSVDSAATKASCGTSTRPMVFIRFLPSFCFSSSLRLRVMSPP
jgi:hypothetical protein